MLLLCVVLAVGAAPAEAAIDRHTKSRAEKNIMLAHRVLARWKVGLVDPETRLPRNNVWVRCSGRGGWAKGGYTRFRCVVGYRRVRVSVTYHAKTRNGCELHDRRVFRV